MPILVAIAQQPRGARIVARIARHRLADHPSLAIAGIRNVPLAKRQEQRDSVGVFGTGSPIFVTWIVTQLGENDTLPHTP